MPTTPPEPLDRFDVPVENDHPNDYRQLATRLHARIRHIVNDKSYRIDLFALYEVLQTAPRDIRQFVYFRFVEEHTMSRITQLMRLSVSDMSLLESKAFGYLTHDEFIGYYGRDRQSALRPTERDWLIRQAQNLTIALEAVRDGRLDPERIELRPVDAATHRYRPRYTYIEQLELTTRMYRSLYHNRITSVEQLIALGADKLRQFRNMGEKTITELVALCHANGFDVRDESQTIHVVSPTLYPVQHPDDIERMIAAIEHGADTNVVIDQYPLRPVTKYD